MVTDLFDAVASGYDKTNRILSFGLDPAWRNKMLVHLPAGTGLRVLDMATGTGDVALALARDVRVREVVGIDLSEGMIKLAREKIAQSGFSGKVRLVQGSALALDFPDRSFDVVTVGFGVRNFSDLMQGLMEAFRILKPKGKIIVLEFSLPASFFVKAGYVFYLKHVVPSLGAFCTGRRAAYDYLVRSILAFPCGERFSRILAQVGFLTHKRYALACGGVTVYVAERGQE